MKRTLALTLILLSSLFIPLLASAENIRAYISDFTVSGGDSADLKTTLKRLMASRLSGDGLITVETPAEADVLISGSYTMLGKMFSLDAAAKSAQGKQLAAAYEQGESIDALIPAVGKISSKLKGEIVKQYPQGAAPAASSPQPSSALIKAPASELLRNEAAPGWTSQRIAGAKSAITSWGTDEILVADQEGLYLYKKDGKLALIAQAALAQHQRLLAVDAIGPDQDGKVLAFVTIIDREAPSSRVYSIQNGTLKPVAQDLPYMFRALAPYGGKKQLFAQEMGRTEDYYGDVYEASFADGTVKLANPIKMPRFANIFNFNLFRDRSGKSYLTCFNDSGYLLVYADGDEIWRSSDKFGGTETYFQRRDMENERTTGTPFRTRFIDQRIAVTEKGEVIVPQNAGFFVLGNARSYSRYSMVAFAWNGSSLEELWRTKASQNYLADYDFNQQRREMVLLEVTQKSGLGGKGGSLVRILRAE
uniref:VCBS repeat-containing protein n=1 Tax=Geobacter sp. (strain M21) TaxID=443144 RepID=C6DZQ9_GEOSM